MPPSLTLSRDPNIFPAAAEAAHRFCYTYRSYSSELTKEKRMDSFGVVAVGLLWFGLWRVRWGAGGRVYNEGERVSKRGEEYGLRMAWWGEGHGKILGGRDVLAGGTWLGCTRDGRLAFLTNVLEPDNLPCAKTRGDLPSWKSPLEFAEELVMEARDYNGFNLILADIPSKLMVYISNRPKEEPISIQVVSPGLHVLSNAKLDTPWYKAQRLGMRFRDLLVKYDQEEIPEKEMVDKLMSDTARADRDRLPNTGCDTEYEFKLSSIFVEFETKQVDGNARFYEKYLEKGVWKDHAVSYNIEKMQ
ncbi:hypothetical protein BHM03_00025642 [Ensete ventricosum]|uniref:Uncharacterized protein n=1 Tax=Ensete ventricosum TaxID=4639 RepID=A0A445MH74_ENSVE|nr:hypothetical protein BHM03_00025642 [Ensete ventricosum]